MPRPNDFWSFWASSSISRLSDSSPVAVLFDFSRLFDFSLFVVLFAFSLRFAVGFLGFDCLFLMTFSTVRDFSTSFFAVLFDSAAFLDFSTLFDCFRAKSSFNGIFGCFSAFRVPFNILRVSVPTAVHKHSRHNDVHGLKRSEKERLGLERIATSVVSIRTFAATIAS